MGEHNYIYDAFISHSVADKIPVADELYSRLTAAGLNIWYSGNELTIGDSISKSINEGLSKSRYGIVILSPSYLSKLWPLQEFYMLWNREQDGHKVILPVLYNITPEELAQKSLGMADRWSTQVTKGLDKVAAELTRAIEQDKQRQSVHGKKQWLLWFTLVIVLLSGLFLIGYYRTKHLDYLHQIAENEINIRINTINQKVTNQIAESVSRYKGKQVVTKEILDRYVFYKDLSSYYRNTYTLDNGETLIQYKKHVNEALGIEVSNLSPTNNYSFASPTIYLWYDSIINGSREIMYSYKNNEPVTYQYKSSTGDSDKNIIQVQYEHSIRYIEIILRFPRSAKDIKKQEMTLIGLPVSEEFYYSSDDGDWGRTQEN